MQIFILYIICGMLVNIGLMLFGLISGKIEKSKKKNNPFGTSTLKKLNTDKPKDIIIAYVVVLLCWPICLIAFMVCD